MGLLKSAITKMRSVIGYGNSTTETPEETVQAVYCQHCEVELTLEGAFISQGSAYCPVELKQRGTDEIPCLYLDRLKLAFDTDGVLQDLHFSKIKTTNGLQEAIKRGELVKFGSLELMALAVNQE